MPSRIGHQSQAGVALQADAVTYRTSVTGRSRVAGRCRHVSDISHRLESRCRQMPSRIGHQSQAGVALQADAVTYRTSVTGWSRVAGRCRHVSDISHRLESRCRQMPSRIGHQSQAGVALQADAVTYRTSVTGWSRVAGRCRHVSDISHRLESRCRQMPSRIGHQSQAGVALQTDAVTYRTSVTDRSRVADRCRHVSDISHRLESRCRQMPSRIGHQSQAGVALQADAVTYRTSVTGWSRVAGRCRHVSDISHRLESRCRQMPSRIGHQSQAGVTLQADAVTYRTSVTGWSRVAGRCRHVSDISHRLESSWRQMPSVTG